MVNATRILSIAAKIAEEFDNKWHGGTGAYISDTVDQVNAFTKESKDVAILQKRDMMMTNCIA